MVERRQEMRKKLMAFTLVYIHAGKKRLGYLDNMTMKGVMVISEKPLAVDRAEILVIELPGNLSGVSTRQMTIPVRVARCVRHEESATAFAIGLEFTEISPENEKIIIATLERYHFQHLIENPLPGDEQ